MLSDTDVRPSTTPPGRTDQIFRLARRTLPLGFGASGVVMPFRDEATAEAAFTTAWDAGIRWFDAAPMYGDGLGETLLGRFLADKPRDEYVLSTKVGRLVRPQQAAAADLDHSWITAFTGDDVRRSLDESLARLGLDRVDVVLVHDPDGRERTVLDETWPAVDDLRRQGVVTAAGIGSTLAEETTRLVERTDADLVLAAGRYTLVDPGAAWNLLPACRARGVRVLAAEALHGGLVRTARHPHFNYRPVPGLVRAHVTALGEACAAHGADLESAALAFPLAHPDVDLLLTGPQDAAQLDANIAWLTHDVPAALWDDLRQRGLLDPGLPTPDGHAGGRTAHGAGASS